MKTIYVKDLTPRQLFENETFAIFEASKGEDRNGKPYYTLLIGDKTGKVSAKIWSDAIENIEKGIIKEGSVIAVTGKVDEYKGAPQIVILDCKAIDETSLDDFVESSMFDPEDMFKDLKVEVDSITNKDLKKVINQILEVGGVKNNIKYWPAANTVHHAFRSGLLQHILEMLTIANGLEKFYPNVDFDILKAGIILHDIGKVYELDGKNISVPYTRRGQLHGHIYLGARLFEEIAEKEKLDSDILDHVLHLILSHHGTHEYGSPVLPATPEAILLTYIDNVSAKARTADSVIQSMGDEQEFSRRVFWLENAKMWNRPKNNKADQMKLV